MGITSPISLLQTRTPGEVWLYSPVLQWSNSHATHVLKITCMLNEAAYLTLPSWCKAKKNTQLLQTLDSKVFVEEHELGDFYQQ